MLILSPEEIRNAEAAAVSDGLSYEDMMECAGRGCAKHILKKYPEAENITILCGKGKNGGDGFVIARYLKKAGKEVNVITCFSSPSDELSEKNRKRIDGVVNIYDGSVVTKKITDLLSKADIIVDAVFGIGFSGELPRNISEMSALIKTLGAKKIAIDIPSGLTVNKELPYDCFTADETLSMLCFKKEHVYMPYSTLCGKVSIIPIGFSYIGDGINAPDSDGIRRLLPVRRFDSNKGSYGKALIIAGSYKMPGAGIISTRGSLCTGAGLTYFAFPDKIYSAVTSQLNECVFLPLSSDESGGFSETAYDELSDSINSFSAIAIGPGLGRGKGAKMLLLSVLKNYKGKLIIDADGINIISDNINVLKETDADILLTPHPGEMSRLTNKDISEINSRRTEAAREFSVENKVTLLLKGVNTVICDPDGRITVNTTGSSALSRGGSGDLLTGIAVSFAAQGLSLPDSAVLSAYIHGLAGQMAEEKFTSYCADIGKITACIPDALSEIISGK